MQFQITMNLSNFNGITWPDYLVIALYFIFVLGVGLYVRKLLLQVILKNKNRMLELDTHPK